MYDFAEQSVVKDAAEGCMEILHGVQKEVSEYFTFDIKLIGSGDKRLVMQNNDEPFDLDYNLILQRDKQGLINNPEQIKNIFINAFNEVAPSLGFKAANNSTSVITERLVKGKKLEFSFDVAILVEDSRGVFNKLAYDKPSGRYFWNEVKGSRDQIERFQQIKYDKLWTEFKNRYKDRKNLYLMRGEKRNSYSIFLEILNELGR